ncbi:MAG: hypothetical protein H8E13_21785 [Actinobacteria bacterium]|nr:hypothetical protein [Actinomycetota bacterium]
MPSDDNITPIGSVISFRVTASTLTGQSTEVSRETTIIELPPDADDVSYMPEAHANIVNTNLSGLNGIINSNSYPILHNSLGNDWSCDYNGNRSGVQIS